MNIISINLSKAARKKNKRGEKTPAKIQVAAPKSFKLTKKDIANLWSYIKPASQQYLWEKLELYGNYKKNNS